MSDDYDQIPVLQAPLNVFIVDGEIVLCNAQRDSPSFTSSAARETGKRLIEAADELDGR